MESVLGRYRNLIILVGVLFLQVLGLAVQVKRGNEQEHTRLIRVWVIGAITPFERGLVWIENGTSNLWHNYFYLRGVRAENRQLKEQIEQMRLEQVRLNEDAAQAHRLQNLLGFKEQFISKTVAAQVIGTSGTDSNRVIYIDKGEDVGIKRDMAVITADGIVGKVSLVYPSEAQVLLINDQTSGVGVILADARLQGWVGGAVNGEVVLNDVMSDEQVPIGEKVLTSGGDRIFPKGLPVGTVTKVGKGKDLFLNIKVKPAADLSRLEEVLVLVEKQERQPMAEGNVRVRAADILAQRLPSVPDKPAAGAGSAAAAEGSGKSATNAAGTNPAPKIATASSVPVSSSKSAPSSNAASSTKSPSLPMSTASGTPSGKPVAPAVKNPADGGNTPTSSKTESQSSAPRAGAPGSGESKTASGSSGSSTPPKSEISQTKPANPQSKTVKPTTPVQSPATRPVADDSTPH
jgi:rod shape-determining protein MreC